MQIRSLAQLFRRRMKNATIAARKIENRVKPVLITIEDRIAPAGIVPTPITLGGGEIPGLTRDPNTPVNFLEGVGVVDPIATNQFVGVGIAVNGTNSSLVLSFQDPNVTGVSKVINVAMITDPAATAAASATVKFTQVYQPSIAYGADGTVHVASLQTNADKSEGALVYNAFTWTAGSKTPTQKTANLILRSWANNTDPVYHPFVTVDNNTATYIDPVFGTVSTDPLSSTSNVYVFWNSSATPTSQIGTGQEFNPAVIHYVASSNTGTSFGASRSVSDAANGYVVTIPAAGTPAKTYGHTSPVVAFSPGNAATPGQISVAFSSTNNGGLYVDQSTPGASPVVSISATNNAGAVTIDGFDPGGGATNHIAGVTRVPVTFNITDPNFISIGDVDVKLALVHSQLNEVQLRLGFDINNTTGVFTDDIFATMLKSRTDTAGTDAGIPPAPFLQQGTTGTAMGAFINAGNGLVVGSATYFDDSCPARPIAMQHRPGGGSRRATARAEGDPLAGHGRIGTELVVGADQLLDVHQARRIGREPRKFADRHRRSSSTPLATGVPPRDYVKPQRSPNARTVRTPVPPPAMDGPPPRPRRCRAGDRPRGAAP